MGRIRRREHGRGNGLVSGRWVVRRRLHESGVTEVESYAVSSWVVYSIVETFLASFCLPWSSSVVAGRSTWDRNFADRAMTIVVTVAIRELP